MKPEFVNKSITDMCFLTPAKFEEIWMDVCPGCKTQVSAIKHDFSLCTQLQNALYRIRELEKGHLDWDADQGNGFNSRGYSAGRGIFHDPMG